MSQLPLHEDVQPDVDESYVENFNRLAADEDADHERVIRDLAQVVFNRYIQSQDDLGSFPDGVAYLFAQMTEEEQEELLEELGTRAENYIHTAFQQDRPE